MSSEIKSLTDRIFVSLPKIFEPLATISSGVQCVALIKKIGYELPSTTGITDAFVALGNFIADFPAMAESIIDQNDLLERAKAIKDLISKMMDVSGRINNLSNAIKNCFPAQSNIDEVAKTLSLRLLDYLMVRYLQIYHPRIYASFILCGIIEKDIEQIISFSQSDSAQTQTFDHYTIVWKRVSKIIFNPMEIAQEVYLWKITDADNGTTDEFNSKRFFENLIVILNAFSLPGGLYSQNLLLSEKINIGSTGEEIPKEIRFPMDWGGVWPESYWEMGFGLSAVQANNNKPKGMAIIPYLHSEEARNYEIKTTIFTISLNLEGGLNIQDGIGLVVRPPHDFEIYNKLFSETAPDIAGNINLELTQNNQDEFILIGAEGGRRVSVAGIGFKFTFSKSEKDSNMGVELSVEKIGIYTSSDDNDGFLSKILPADPIIGSITCGISSAKGFYISGGAGFEQTFEYLFQVQKSLGPIFIDTFDLALSTSDNDLALITAVSGTASIGPVKVSLIKIGMETSLNFSKPGLLGNADLSVGFKPPTGVGLEINSSSVRGAGGLIVENGNYSGWLDLEINKKISVQAICIITTRTPDGLETFSFKILGFVEFPPVQIGFGFSISGVGLAIAINCCMNEEKLRSAVYDGSLKALLFPTNLIENAPQIIRDLNDFFPIQEDTYIIGAMAKLGWGGGNPIITADIGILFEFGSNLRIALAGIAYAYLPNTESPILSLKMQVLGLINFGNKTLSIDASLNGSKLMDWALDGDMALRSAWGDNPRFALSIGGFYPGYKPPEGFPSLNRISLAIGTGNPKIQLLCYLAITENSVQIGAALIFYWHKKYDWPVGNIELDGVVGFDALFQFNPFYFETKFYAAFNLKRNGDDLMSIDLQLTLSGPNNYHAVGKAKIEICRVGITVKFDKEFGSKRPEIQQVLSPVEILKQELGNEKNWFVRQFNDQTSDTIVVEKQDTENLVEPLGTICFAQRAVPLQFRLDKIGKATLEGSDRWFDIVHQREKDEPLTEFFAPGDFENLSDEEKVSGPAFEKMKGGIAITLDQEIECDMSAMKSRQVQYETSGPDIVSTPANGSEKTAYQRLENVMCYKTDALTRKISNSGKKLYTSKPLLLKALDTTNSYRVKEQEITAINNEFQHNLGPMSYSQARQKYKEMGGVKTATHLADFAKVLCKS